MKVKRLTPSILKKIIAEEKAKLNISRKKVSRKNKNKKSLIEKKVNQLTRLALLEVREKLRLKKIKRAKLLVKKSLR
jgi:hypothetical protein